MNVPLHASFIEASAKRVMAMCADAIAKGARYALEPTRKAALVSPGILVGDSSESRLWREEVFGPIALVIPFDGVALRLRIILELIEQFRHIGFKYLLPLENWDTLQSDHRPIANAIKARDARAAKAAMSLHFQKLRTSISRSR